MFDVFGWFAAAEPAVKISTLALGLSVVTALVAAGGLVTAVRSLNATRRQEKRREPRLRFAHLASSWSNVNSEIHYSFKISAQNATDASNAISSAELQIRYLVEGQEVSLRASSQSAPAALTVPAPVPAGSSVQGTILFGIAKQILGDRSPRGFELHLTDTFGAVTTIPIGMIQEGRTK